MIDQYQSFVAMPNAETVTDFIAITLYKDRRDFLVKGVDGEPVFLHHAANHGTVFLVQCQVLCE